MVSTHSHPKVAAKLPLCENHFFVVSTHSHPKVAARRGVPNSYTIRCFNTQPPEGGCIKSPLRAFFINVSTHSHPKVAASVCRYRKRWHKVSTHSHPKVAAGDATCVHWAGSSFNTQPPEGGCSLHKKARQISKLNTVFR